MARHIYTARANTNKPTQGFTIVELLIVIVVIAILAAITVVAFNGIRARAIDSSMQSDLRNSVSTLEIDNGNNGSYPATAAAANNGQGLKSSGGNVLTYTLKPYGYCATVSNSGSTKTYVVKSMNNRIIEGDCNVTVSTVAGSGTYSYADGNGTAAQFRRPQGLVVSPSGIIYVADTSNQRIRQISTTNDVSPFVGSGSIGATNDTGAAASFNYPNDLAMDGSGNIYVADNENHRIRKITPSGVVSTYAGTGVAGATNGASTSAQFNYPTGVAVDSSGVVYVADTNNHRIRKIATDGTVSTFAGSSNGYLNGTSTSAQFSYPNSIAIDGSGNLYVTDTNNNRVRKVTAGGVVSTVAGSGTYGYANGSAATAQFAGPTGIALDGSGAIYVVDCDNNYIRVIDTTGTVSSIAGTGSSGFTEGLGATAQINYPRQIQIDINGGVMYVADMWNNRIRKITL